MSNSKDYKIHFSIFQLTNLYIKFQLVLFKPLCLPATYSLNLSKFAIFLSKNPIYTSKQIQQFSYETIETLIIPLNFSQNIDAQYFTELIYRYKKLIVAFINIQTICQLDKEDEDNEEFKQFVSCMKKMKTTKPQIQHPEINLNL